MLDALIEGSNIRITSNDDQAENAKLVEDLSDSESGSPYYGLVDEDLQEKPLDEQGLLTFEVTENARREFTEYLLVEFPGELATKKLAVLNQDDD